MGDWAKFWQKISIAIVIIIRPRGGGREKGGQEFKATKKKGKTKLTTLSRTFISLTPKKNKTSKLQARVEKQTERTDTQQRQKRKQTNGNKCLNNVGTVIDVRHFIRPGGGGEVGGKRSEVLWEDVEASVFKVLSFER